MTGTRIGIGIGEDCEKVTRSILQSRCSSRTTGYCRPGTFSGIHGIALKEDPSPERALVRDLCNGTLGAAVRGTLPANATLAALKEATGVPRLERAALLETTDGRRFLLAPVGIDEGWTVGEKVSLVRNAERIARTIGLSGDIAILSGGRLGDAGRHPRVDESLGQAELVAKLTGAHHFEILIEDAIATCCVILAPDGISGNLIFRTLTFLGSGHGHGAPVLNIPKIFVDTSRASPDYVNALHLADALAAK